MKYHCLFFDLDDTIWDIKSNGRESMEEVFQDYGFDRFFHTFDDFYNVYFPSNLRLWERYRNGKITKDELIVERLLYPLRPFGINDKSFAIKLNDDFLRRTTLKTKLIPHTKEILEYLRPQYKLFILSNGFREVQYDKITNSGLDIFFDGIFLSDEMGYNKPHPKIFEKALQKANFKFNETIMIGDSWDADIVGAKNAMIDQIWYNPEHATSVEFKPTYEISTLLELKNIL